MAAAVGPRVVPGGGPSSPFPTSGGGGMGGNGGNGGGNSMMVPHASSYGGIGGSEAMADHAVSEVLREADAWASSVVDLNLELLQTMAAALLEAETLEGEALDGFLGRAVAPQARFVWGPCLGGGGG